MANPYLQVDGLTKSFGDLVLFENISFGVAEGQRIGLIAKNGSGKTTLLSILSGKVALSIVVTCVWDTWNKTRTIRKNSPYWKRASTMVLLWCNSSRNTRSAWRRKEIRDWKTYSPAWSKKKLGTMNARPSRFFPN